MSAFVPYFTVSDEEPNKRVVVIPPRHIMVTEYECGACHARFPSDKPVHLSCNDQRCPMTPRTYTWSYSGTGE